MATSPLFGWEEPDDTDLVKDGAAAIRTLGNAIDTSMGDLLGGTSGQILSKASATDMDFAWITNDVGDITAVTAGTGISGGGTSGAVTITNSMATEITAKGDVIVGTGSATFDNLAAGANGTTLVADSSTATGLRYQVPVNSNPVLNSAFQVWQRGTSIVTANGYTADRWQFSRFGGGAGATVSRVAGTGSQYAAKIQRDSGNTGTGALQFAQTFESANSIYYAGQTVTLSFYAKKGANYSSASSALSVALYSGTGTDQNIYSGFTGSLSPINSTATLTTNLQQFTYTGTISSTATQLGLYFAFTPTGTAGADDSFTIQQVQLEVGSVATPFKTYAGTIQQELAACQRYYIRQSVAAASNYLGGIGTSISTTQARISFFSPVAMRVQPTSADFGGVSLYDGVSFFPVTGAGISTDANNINFYIVANVASGLTQFRTYYLVSGTAGSSFTGFSAEL